MNLGEEQRDLLQERERRIKELFYLSKDPLFEQIGRPEADFSGSDSQDPSSNLGPIDISILGKNEDKLVEELEQIVDKALFTKKTGDKRKLSHDLDSINHNHKSKRTKLLPDFKESIDQQQSRFVSKNLEDVDILSVPQHYPTAPHNVSSLAELYYLTQTLPLIKLLPGSHKALMTESFESALLEGKIAVLYSRIEELKRQGKWSLRQPIKYKDPFTISNKKPVKFHWDNVLRESHWMATDFKEQSKFKKACCVTVASAVQDYWKLGKEATCIKPKPIVHLSENALADAMEVDEPEVTAETEVVKEGEGIEVEKEENEGEEKQADSVKQENEDEKEEAETVKEEVKEEEVKEEEVKEEEVKELKEGEEIEQKEEPSIDVSLLTQNPEHQESIFESTKAAPTDYQPPKEAPGPFKLHVNLSNMKKIDQSIIKNLPKFSAFDDEEIPNLGSQPLKPNDNQVVPVSKLLYPFDEDDGFYKILVKDKDKSTPKTGMPEYQKGIFGAQAHRRFNYLKPPKPPLIKNIEYRSPTIWLPQDDKHLIHYVAEFCFNWDLISEHLSAKYASMRRYESNIERRTPWQCFERYIQLNEKFQFSDMKGPSSYHAQQWLEQAHKAQSTTKRRISPLGIGNESIQRGHRRLRWASMFDAMRKCMRKRENQIAKMNSRRATDYTQQLNNNNSNKNDKVPSPAELSRLKYERDKSIQEAYLNQQATRNRMMAAVAQQQKQQQGQQGQNQQSQNQNQQGQQQSYPQGKAPSNGSGESLSPPPSQRIGPNGVSPTNSQMSQGSGSPAPAPASMAIPELDANGRPKNGQNPPYTQEQIQKLIQLQRQRKLMQSQGQYPQRPVQPGSSQSGQSTQSSMGPSGTNSIPQNVDVNRAPGNSMLGRAAPVNKTQQSPPGQQVQPSNNSNNSNKPRIHFAPAQVSAIINSIQTKNPNLSKEQVTKLAASYLANLQQQHQQRLNQQRLQNRGQPVPNQQMNQQAMNQPQMNQGQMNQQAISQQRTGPQTRQPQVATLTAQERNQLQMLKAAKTAQQQQQLQQMQQIPPNQSPNQQQFPGQIGQQTRSSSGSPVMSANNPQLNRANMTKAEYESRLRMVMQKHQQKLQQQQYQNGQNMPMSPNPGSPASGPGSGDASSKSSGSSQ